MTVNFTIDDALHVISDQILANHPKLDDVVLIGLLSHGVPLAKRLQRMLHRQSSIEVPIGEIETSLYRDDLTEAQQFITIQNSDIPFPISDKNVILVDGTIFHGRRIRAALNGLTDFGRPKKIELAALIDRGHRKLPVMANYIGHSIVTKEEDDISIRLLEIDGEDDVVHTKASSSTPS